MIIANQDYTKFVAVDSPLGRISHPYIAPLPFHFKSAFAASVALENYKRFNTTDTDTYAIKNGWMVLDESGGFKPIYFFDNKDDAERKKEEWDAQIAEMQWDTDDDWDFMIRVKAM